MAVNEKNNKNKDFLNHFIPSRDIILLENEIEYLEIGRKTSINTINSFLVPNGWENLTNNEIINKFKKGDYNSSSPYIVIIPQKNANLKNINNEKDLRDVGIKCEILDIQLINDDKNYRIKLKGIEKVNLVSFNLDSENASTIFIGKFKDSSKYIIPKEISRYQEEMKFLLSFLQEPAIKNHSFFKNFFGSKAINSEMDFFDIKKINTFLLFLHPSFEKKYTFFKASNFSKKLVILTESLSDFFETIKSNELLDDNNDVLSPLKNNKKDINEEEKNIEKEIEEKLKDSLNKQNKEFILREKIKIIKNILGDDKEEEKKVEEILSDEKTDTSKLVPDDVKIIIKKEMSKLKSMMASSPDANICRSYIDILTQLPWRKTSIENIEIDKVKKELEENHYGLKDVKERIIELVAVMINNRKKHPDKYKKTKIANEPNTEINENLFVKDSSGQNKINNENASPIITLLGPPGVGKTSIAKSLATALNRRFVKISLGGIKDEAEIRGHRRTYVGAMPGKIINAIKKAGVSNPVILLDEIDKVSSYKGDPAAALLEVLDPEQNSNFQDHYLEVEYDLSKVLFIATANYYEDIPAPLLDRVELIELSSYTIFEKINIAKKYLIPKAINQNGLETSQFKINDEDIEYIIKHYTLEAGVRGLYRVLDKIARKITLGVVTKEIGNEFTINREIIKKFLGTEKFSDPEESKTPLVGCVNGLAYTSYGGSTLQIEVTTFPGKGEIKLTGQLKDVMQESAQIALAYVKANAKKFGIDFNFDEHSIHIHVPEGAVPKDGPSAGITFTTAIISALTNKPVSHKVGMTGEITLRGKVLPIGGLKEKSLAALKNGIKTIFIPKDNIRNLEDVVDEVKNEIEFIPVSDYNQVYEQLFKGVDSVSN